MTGPAVRRAARAALLTSFVLIAGCGSSTASPAAPVRTTAVDMPRSYRFAPAAIVVDSGATVTWTNSDNFTHSVQFLDGGLPAEPMVIAVGGAPVMFTFNETGTFHYQCSFHPTDMQGTITVE
jgi:plastocyanin